MSSFAFPADKLDFTGANGITYTWDVTDEKWRVKAFRSQDDFLVVVGDTPPDEPKEGDLWWDSSPDSLTLFVYEGTAWVPAAPPVSLDGINATIDAALIVQNELLARVESGEIAQTALQDTVAIALDVQATLQHKVEALEGTVIDGKWYAESRSNPREGGFDITSGGLQSMGDWNADFLRIHKTDTTGKVFTFAEVSTGDYIRIGAPGSTAVYKITDVPSGSLDWQAFGVELANFTGTPIPDLTYDFEFLPSFDPSAYATVQYVDAQDDLDVKLATVNDVSTGFRIKSDGNTLISTATAGELGLYHVKDPSDGNAEWAATKGYVDDNFINIAGQTDLDPQVFKIRQPNSDGNFRSFINIHNGDMNLYNVVNPSGSGHEKWAANKEYVDNVASEYLPLTGGNLTGDVETTGKLTIDHGTGNTAEKKLHIIGETADGTEQDLFWSYKNAEGTLDAVNYKGKIDNDFNLVNKGYVDAAVAGTGGGVPVGCIMIWMSSSAPAGWFKLQGGSFDVNTYPQLHSYLSGTAGYTSGSLPNWSGHYPGEYGDHMATSLGTKVEARTGRPAGGAPRSSNSIPNGTTRTFNATGNTNAYSAGASKVTIDENWDNTTRPKTVVVHYIIKHD